MLLLIIRLLLEEKESSVVFSYAEYRNIITLVKQNLPIMDFADVTSQTESFCVIRHDIEFSVDSPGL